MTSAPLHSGLLTPERESEIMDYLKGGVPAVHAAHAAGIGERTYYEWRARGREHEEKCKGEKCKHRDHKYLLFLQRSDTAKSQAVASYSLKLRELAGAGDVKAITFYLSHSDRDNWFQRSRNEMVGEDGDSIKVELKWPE